MDRNVTIKRTITINGVTYDDADAVPADVREQYDAILKLMEADADGNGIPDFIERGALHTAHGEAVTEKLVEVRIDRGGPGEVVNPEAWGKPEVTKSRHIKLVSKSPADTTVRRSDAHSFKVWVLMAALAWAAYLLSKVLFNS